MTKWISLQPHLWDELTDVLLPANLLQDVDLLHRCLPDLLDLLWAHLVRGGDVDDLHRILLRRPLVQTAAHHTAYSPDQDNRTPRLRNRVKSKSHIWKCFPVCDDKYWTCICNNKRQKQTLLCISYQELQTFLKALLVIYHFTCSFCCFIQRHLSYVTSKSTFFMYLLLFFAHFLP